MSGFGFGHQWIEGSKEKDQFKFATRPLSNLQANHLSAISRKSSIDDTSSEFHISKGSAFSEYPSTGDHSKKFKFSNGPEFSNYSGYDSGFSSASEIIAPKPIYPKLATNSKEFTGRNQYSSPPPSYEEIFSDETKSPQNWRMALDYSPRSIESPFISEDTWGEPKYKITPSHQLSLSLKIDSDKLEETRKAFEQIERLSLEIDSTENSTPSPSFSNLLLSSSSFEMSLNDVDDESASERMKKSMIESWSPKDKRKIESEGGFLFVTEVVSGSQAHQGGVRRGDVFTKFGPFRAHNFPGLAHIAKYVSKMASREIDCEIIRVRGKQSASQKRVLLVPVNWEHGVVLGMVVDSLDKIQLALGQGVHRMCPNEKCEAILKRKQSQNRQMNFRSGSY
jgi:hypothetical protein